MAKRIDLYLLEGYLNVKQCFAKMEEVEENNVKVRLPVVINFERLVRVTSK
jgi:hypothetical protein